MAKDTGGPKDPSEEDTDKVVIPFRGRWKGGQQPPQTLADGTVVESIRRGWASWLFKPYPVVQNTCVACLRKRREEHEACGFEDCDCFCTAGKLWPLWALFGLAPPKDKPIPPQLLGLAQHDGAELEEKAEGEEAGEAPQSAHRMHSWAAALAVAVLVLASGSVVLVEHFRKVDFDALTNSGADTVKVVGVGSKMGERKVGRPMPHKALPNQAVAPCRGSAKAFYGGCWMGPFEARAPCPPDQFEEGGKCYVPQVADPNFPVGE